MFLFSTVETMISRRTMRLIRTNKLRYNTQTDTDSVFQCRKKFIYRLYYTKYSLGTVKQIYSSPNLKVIDHINEILKIIIHSKDG